MAKRRSNKLLYVLISIVLLLVVFAVVGKSKGWIGKKQETEVTLEKIKTGEITEKVSASGKIQPEIEIKIAPEVSGEITDLLIKEGDSVKRGQLLLKIRPDKIKTVLDQTIATFNNSKAMAAQTESALASAEAQFIKAEQDYKRNVDLYKQKVVSSADFQQAEANYKVAKQSVESARQNLKAANYSIVSAQARVKEAQENLYLTQIYAPEGGIISLLSIEKGERVVGTSQMAGTELLRIADLQQMEVRVDVNENDIIKVSKGDTAIIDVDAYSNLDKKFKGIVTAIANTAKSTSSSDAVTEFEVRIKILQESFDYLQKEKHVAVPFRPGMTASVDIITEKKQSILLSPLGAVSTRNKEEKKDSAEGKEGQEESSASQSDKGNDDQKAKKDDDLKEVVFVYENGKVKMVEVKTGLSDYDHIEVISGLKAGDQVVAGPYIAVSKKLKDGDIVKIKEEEKGKKKS